MRFSFRNTVTVTLAAALAAAALAGCSNRQTASPSPSAAPPAQTAGSAPVSPSASPAVKLTKEQIEAKLEAGRANLLDVTWAPDESAVIYLRSGSSGANICIWKTDQEKEQVVCEAEATLDGLLWSPDSRYFLIETGHMGPATITSAIIETITLKQLGEDVTTVNVSAPVWSPDSKYLALSTEDESTGKIDLNIYALASKSSVSVVSAENAKGPYIVEYWKNGTIGYTALTASGERAEQTVAIGD